MKHAPSLLLALTLLSGAAAGQTVVLEAGLEDDFTPPNEPAAPSATVAALLTSTDDFDGTTINSNVVHTFDLPCGIVAAELVFEVRGVRESVETDGVVLGFADASSNSYASSVAWARHFGPNSGTGSTIFPDPDPGLLPATWTGSSQQRFVLDLDALPLASGGTTSLIDSMNQRGFIDVLTGDDSATDFYRLTLTLGSTSAAVSYCTSGTSATGCNALTSASGTASATAASGFALSASAVEGSKDGLFFFGTSGRQASPWGNGTSFQCVVPPVKRGGLQTGLGTPGQCDGTFTQDLNALWCSTCPKPLHNPGAGAVVQAQLWYRDPLNTSNQTTTLSDAIEFCVQP